VGFGREQQGKKRDNKSRRGKPISRAVFGMKFQGGEEEKSGNSNRFQ